MSAVLLSTGLQRPTAALSEGRKSAATRPRSLLVRAVATDGRDATGLSSLRFAKPSQNDIQTLVSDTFKTRLFNHEHTGASVTAPNLPEEVKKGGFMITTNRKKIGDGKKVFDTAVKAIKAWEQLQLGWNFTTRPALSPGATICSATQTVVPWSVLPAQARSKGAMMVVVYSKEAAADFGAKGGKGRRFAVGLASLTGHQLAGEERFSVELHADGSVWYDVFLFSRPDTLLAWASLPVVKLQQIRYVNDSLKALAAAVAAR